MPTYLDFNSTKSFRDFLIEKTLNVPNGPQTFTEDDYIIQGTNDYANVDPGDVETNLDQQLSQTQSQNIFKPLKYWVTDHLRVIPRRANLHLYPYFVPGEYTLISIMATDNYETESELFKFAAYNIRENENGPVYARIQQNLYAATVGRIRFVDAIEGNLATALNILTGREPLIEYNTKVTTRPGMFGKAVDFLGTVAGTQWPFSVIPGDYLTDPRHRNPNPRPEAQTEGGRFLQDLTGALGSLIGIQRRPIDSRKPSDILLDFTGSASKNVLYDNLSYSKYAPNYSATARNQNTSKIFNFVDKIGMGINKLIGLDAPPGVAYIGDDRGENVKFAMGDFNDNLVKSPWYLGIMFDEVQARLFHGDKNYSEGGEITGKLVWISTNSQNKLGANNDEYGDISSDVEKGLSTKFTFRDTSILGKTQSLLNTMPANGGESRSHVANAIDQTSRIFKEGDVFLSRGSAIKYVDKYTGVESGVEYCRVWTKDRPYLNMSDVMKNTSLIRNQNIPEANGSVLDNAYNLNIYPNSNGNKDFQGSTNIKEGENGFFAKKYMFSIENLAWKTSNVPGFTYTDLPYCERGNNGGRVMWFPPYDLKVTEQNNANWEATNFLGRPEPIYTYQNTQRNGTVSFKVVVDHPSILNLLVRDFFKDMSDEEAENYINAFFAGCKDVDFYDLIRKYTTLSKDDITRIQDYLNSGNDPKMVTTYKTVLNPVKDDNLPDKQTGTGANGDGSGSSSGISFNGSLYFQNDIPENTNSRTTTETYESCWQRYFSYEHDYIVELENGLDILFNGAPNNEYKKNDLQLLYGKSIVDNSEIDTLTGNTETTINEYFDKAEGDFIKYDDTLKEIKQQLSDKKTKDIEIRIESKSSSVASNEYNLNLSYRRSYSIILDILDKIKNDGATRPNVTWENNTSTINPISLKQLGYDWSSGKITFKIINLGESSSECSNKDFKTSDYLKRTAPITFFCRKSIVNIDTTVAGENDKAQGTTDLLNSDNPNIPKVILEPVDNIPSKNKRPPLDELKRIIMKTLSECYYFQKFEEDSPVAFKSLRDKLKYFHPGFHSTTPEGLNARLTFLNQCIRPGDTMPIKGVSDINDLNARNTTFGPPPICVMRIGDFYHSKIIIRDVNITYDDGVWDLNPEGIGIQPMIANVTLQISFIGGHGLEKPVELLQNALSSNFYANTEMYDYRSTATENRSRYTKEFLEDLLKKDEGTPTPDPNSDTSNNAKTGEYIGVETTVNDVMTLEYTKYVNDTFGILDEYFNSHKDTLSHISSKYGSKVTSMFLSPEYRTVHNYIVQTGSGTETIELLGEYVGQKDFTYFSGSFSTMMDEKRQSTNISELIKLDKDLGEGLLIKSEQYLQIYLKDKIIEWEDDFNNNSSIKSVETSRNKLISTLDNLNFIIEHNHDGYLTDQTSATGVTFTGYTNFYDKYDNVIDYIQSHYHKFTDDLDTSFIFDIKNGDIPDDVFSELLSELLYTNKEEILDLYRKDPNNSFSNYITKIDKRLNKFLSEPKSIDVNLKKFPKQKDTNPVIFTVSGDYTFTEDETSELIKIMSNKVDLGSTLNFYKL